MISIEKYLKSLLINYASSALKVNTNIMFRVLIRNDDLDTLL